MSSDKRLQDVYSVGDKAGGGGHRRTWDKLEYEKKAHKRKEGEIEKLELDIDGSFSKASGSSGGSHELDEFGRPVKRAFLEQRKYRVDFDANLGRTNMVTKTATGTEVGGYYCSVCDCVVKDSINYLDHINGKKHQRNMGMSMRVERSTLEQVKARFETNKKKKEEKVKDYCLEDRISEIGEERERYKAKQKEAKLERHRLALEKEKADSKSNVDEDISKMMGFGGFGGSKKN